MAVNNYILPGLLVLAVLCGVYASNTYNKGATVYVTPASGPDSPPTHASSFRPARSPLRRNLLCRRHDDGGWMRALLLLLPFSERMGQE